MFTIEYILSAEMVQKLGWSLIHFIWQAAVVAILAAVLLRILRSFSASLRYALACLALIIAVLLPVVTMRYISISVPTSVEVMPAPEPINWSTQPAIDIPAVETANYVEEKTVIPAPAKTNYFSIWKQRVTGFLESSMPNIVTIWLLGVLGFSLWHLGGWTQLQRLRRRLVRPVDAFLKDKLAIIADRLGVKQVVELLESAVVQIPTVVGWVRPVILLPASALTGLSSEQLGAILAHELAHIRRFDYLVNMLQTVVEILGFYNPAIWWLSHRIRVERENCCDDLAVSVCGDRISYARALASLEEIRSRSELALAATGGNLFARICRIVGKDSPTKTKSWVPAVIIIALLIALTIPATLALSAKSSLQNSEPNIAVQIHEQKSEPNFWITFLPNSPIRSLKEYYHTYLTIPRPAAPLYKPAQIPDCELEIRSADNTKRVARIPYKELSGAAGVTFTEQAVRRIGQISEGEYLLAFYIGDKRCSNVAQLTIDSKFKPDKYPTLSLIPFEMEPGQKVPVFGIRAVGPTPQDTTLQNDSIAFPKLVVDGVERNLTQIKWVGPVGPLESGKIYTRILTFDNYTPVVEPGQKHTLKAIVGKYESPPVVIPADDILDKQWDKATANLPPIPLPKVVLAGQVIDSNGQVGSNFEVNLFGQNSQHYSESSDKDGKYRFFNVPSGEYKVECNPKGKGQPGLTVEQVKIVADVPLLLNLSLEKKYKFAGRMTYEDGKPAAGIDIALTCEDANGKAQFIDFTNADANGRYELGGPYATVTYIGINGVRIRAEMPKLKPGMTELDYVLKKNEQGKYIGYQIEQLTRDTSVQVENEQTWGQAVEGVQVRLQADKTTWKAGETPKFKADVRNTGSRELLVYRTETLCELNVDGQMYHHQEGQGKSSVFSPGKQYDGIEITFSERWDRKSPYIPLNRLVPGKYKVYVVFSIDDARRGSIEPPPASLKVASNPVEIEILPTEETNDAQNNSGKDTVLNAELKILKDAEQSDAQLWQKFLNRLDSQIGKLKADYPQLADWDKQKTVTDSLIVGKEITSTRLTYNHAAFSGKSPGSQNWCKSNGCYIIVKLSTGLESPYVNTRSIRLTSKLSILSTVITGQPLNTELEKKVNEVIDSVSASITQPGDENASEQEKSAWQDYTAISNELYKGANREEIAQRYLKVGNKYPDTKSGRISLELGKLLEQMAKEDKSFVQPRDIESLSDQQKIDYYIFKLRDVAEQEMFIPGKCFVLRGAKTPNSAAVALRKMGSAVVPAMIALLQDHRPTRSVGLELNGGVVLRYCDIALEILADIAGKNLPNGTTTFDPRTERGAYLSSADAKTAAEIIQRVNKWWEQNKNKIADQVENEKSTISTGKDTSRNSFYNLQLTELQKQTIMPILSSLTEDIYRIASKYPELREYRKENAIKTSDASIDVGFVQLTYQYNFTPPRTMWSVGSITASDFGPNGIYIQFKCSPIPPADVPAYQMSPPTLTLRNIGLYLWAGVKTGSDPSAGLVNAVQSLLQSSANKLQEIDKQKINTVTRSTTASAKKESIVKPAEPNEQIDIVVSKDFVTRIFPLKYRNPAEIMQLLNNIIVSDKSLDLTSPGETARRKEIVLVSVTENNWLIVRTPSEYLKRIQFWVEKLDVPSTTYSSDILFSELKRDPNEFFKIYANEVNQPQAKVLIETKIMQVSDVFLREVGLDANSLKEDSLWSKYRISDANGYSRFTLDQLTADLFLKNVKARKYCRIICKPQVIAKDCQNAQMKVITQEWFMKSPPKKPSTKELMNVEAGMVLGFTPTIKEDNKIQLAVDLKISDFNEATDRKSQKGLPGVDVLFATSSTDDIPEGNSLLIIGSQVTQTVESSSKTPILGDLPLVGGLFRARSYITDYYIPIILIKPTILTKEHEESLRSTELAGQIEMKTPVKPANLSKEQEEMVRLLFKPAN